MNAPLRFAIALLLLLASSLPSGAQSLRFVVPYPPGAANDTLTRLLAQRLGEMRGETVVVENKPGAGGHLAAEQVAHGTPDGRTLLVTTNGLIAIGPHLYRKLPYDPQTDLAPVIRFASVPYALSAAPGLGISTVGELLALARAKPDRINFASSGNGSVPHLCGELISLRAGIRMMHVPYKGGAQAMNDVMSGTVDLYCGSIPPLLGFTQSGRLRLLGTTSPKRSPLLPDLATFDEQGLRGVDVDSWVGLHAPGKTPPALLEKLHAEIASLMADEKIRQAFRAQAAEPESLPPAEFTRRTAEESKRWAPVVAASGARLD